MARRLSTLIDLTGPMSGEWHGADAPPRGIPVTDDREPSLAEGRLVELFDAMGAAHAQAAAIAGVQERYFQIGSGRLHLRFADPALATRLTPALEHLAVAPAPSDLTCSSGIRRRAACRRCARPGRSTGTRPGEDLRGHASGRMCVGFSSRSCAGSDRAAPRGSARPARGARRGRTAAPNRASSASSAAVMLAPPLLGKTELTPPVQADSTVGLNQCGSIVSAWSETSSTC